MDIFTNTFPVLAAFENLDMFDNLQIAKKALYGLSGIYAFVNIETGASYIGSSIDIGGRIMEHINNSTNPHLHYAILKYGLSLYAFVILECCLSSDQLKREQHFLDLLKTYPKELCYNIAIFAEAPFKGLTHTPESRALMSDAKLGDNNPIQGRTHTPEAKAQISDSKSGAKNPNYGNYGITPTNAMAVNIYSIDNVLVHSFTSQVAAAKFLGVSNITVIRHLRSGKVFQGKYFITSTPRA